MAKVLTEEEKKEAAARMKAGRDAAKAKKKNTVKDDSAAKTSVPETLPENSEKPETGNSELLPQNPALEATDDELQEMQEGQATGQHLYTEEEMQTIAAEAGRKAAEDAIAKMPPLRIYTSTTDENVTVLFISEVSEKSILLIPGYGSLTPGSTLDVPKKEFGGQFMTPLVRKLLSKREMLVLSGLNEDERIRWGVNYKDGEVMDVKTFEPDA